MFAECAIARPRVVQGIFRPERTTVTRSASRISCTIPRFGVQNQFKLLCVCKARLRTRSRPIRIVSNRIPFIDDLFPSIHLSVRYNTLLPKPNQHLPRPGVNTPHTPNLLPAFPHALLINTYRINPNRLITTHSS
jgi:hypothetical protein